MTTLTIYQHSVLKTIIPAKEGYTPADSKMGGACNALFKAGLIKLRGDKFLPISGATYNYRGNKYTF